MTFQDFIAAAEKGAASVYHAVLSIGAEITSWESNPAVQPLLQVGVAAANGMLVRAGIPAEAANVAEADVATALKSMAAADPTVPSIQGLLTLGGTILSAVVPAAAPLVAIAEGIEQAIVHA